MNKETIKNKFNDVKNDIKTGVNKVTKDEATRTSLKDDIKNKNFSGAAETVKGKLSEKDTKKAS